MRLLDAAITQHIRLFIVLALATAGRMAAILDLTWDRVDLQSGVIRSNRRKRRKGRAAIADDQRFAEALGIRKRSLSTHCSMSSNMAAAGLVKSQALDRVAASVVCLGAHPACSATPRPVWI